MGSVIGKSASLLPPYSGQTSFSAEETSNMTKYSFEAKQDVGLKDDCVACLNQWTDEITYKYLDVALTDDLEKNPLTELYVLDSPTSYMEGSADKFYHGSPPRSDNLTVSSTESDCSRTNEEIEENEKSYLELENKILRDYDQAKSSRSLLSKIEPLHCHAGE